MKSITMKGKSVEDAVSAAVAVLGINKEQAKVRIINEGKPAVMGILGGQEAEVEVSATEGSMEEAKMILEEILDKMRFLAMVEASQEEETIKLVVKGEDMGRIIGKEGAMLKALETVVGAILFKMAGKRERILVDAGDYREKRIQALERLANEVVNEVVETKKEKTMPPMSASDRRIIHLCLQNNKNVTTYSTGEGKDRRLTIAPKTE